MILSKKCEITRNTLTVRKLFEVYIKGRVLVYRYGTNMKEVVLKKI